MITLLTKAIQSQFLIEFEYDGGIRVVEPHCHGLSLKGNHVLRAYQVDGYSSTGAYGWKLYDISKVTTIIIREDIFPSVRTGYSKGDKGMISIYCEL
ncbi:hypothetical protein INP83_05020 [Mucilaginibacter sp. 21P]|uniref:hypothetical protein n=1 Tax=Mucilaginibacter sp. 21P TaxID=2778902 RepID=UPI001C587C31|nr:hypothetical protein [Mucilaginibacter sp. 21P]QXV66448.1 hypothetical protein INP83_05020 [Mucilaginibacter sp. 21P]